MRPPEIWRFFRLDLFLFPGRIFNLQLHKESVLDKLHWFLSSILLTASLFGTSSVANASILTDSMAGFFQSYESFVSVASTETSDIRLVASIWKNSKEFGIDPLLALAVVKQESKFKRSAYNKGCECYGPMQVNHFPAMDYAQRFGLPESKIPNYKNSNVGIRIGVWYLSIKLTQYTDVRLALMAYNGGDKYVALMLKKGVLETPYVQSILGFTEIFRARGGYRLFGELRTASLWRSFSFGKNYGKSVLCI